MQRRARGLRYRDHQLLWRDRNRNAKALHARVSKNTPPLQDHLAIASMHDAAEPQTEGGLALPTQGYSLQPSRDRLRFADTSKRPPEASSPADFHSASRLAGFWPGRKYEAVRKRV